MCSRIYFRVLTFPQNQAEIRIIKKLDRPRLEVRDKSTEVRIVFCDFLSVKHFDNLKKEISGFNFTK